MNFLANEPLSIALPLPICLFCVKLGMADVWQEPCLDLAPGEIHWGKADFPLKVVSHSGTRYCLFITIYVLVFLHFSWRSLVYRITMVRTLSQFSVLLGLQFQVSQLYPILSSFVLAHQRKPVYVDQKFLGILGLAAARWRCWITQWWLKRKISLNWRFQGLCLTFVSNSNDIHI